MLAKHTEIENLNLLVLKLKRMHFGQRSEKMNADIAQLELRLEDLRNQRGCSRSASAAAGNHRRERERRHGRRNPLAVQLPAELPREIETIAPKQERPCPDCGGRLRLLPVKNVSEVLEYVPATLQSNPHGKDEAGAVLPAARRIVQEPAPNRPIDKGLAGPGLLAHVLVAKYADQLPLYRQSEIYAREGVELDRSTMALTGWAARCRTLRPLVEALKELCAER